MRTTSRELGLAVFCLSLGCATARHNSSQQRTDYNRPQPKGQAQPVAQTQQPGPVSQMDPPERRPEAMSDPLPPPSSMLSCTEDRDCVELPSVCPECPPCKPTWRLLGTPEQLESIQGTQRAMGACLPPQCPTCASESNWRGEPPVCHNGTCTFAEALNSAVNQP